jgi:carbon-monoxide dehydrogenase large subunit
MAVIMKSSDKNSAALVGSPIRRVEDLRLLRGKGRYIDDLNREGLLHAAVFRSAVAHGSIKSINAAAARRLPGVVDRLEPSQATV